MITRSKLVEQLREYQIRSEHKWAALVIFSPKPQIITRTDLVTGLIWALLFCILVISSYAESFGEEKGEKIVAAIVHVNMTRTSAAFRLNYRLDGPIYSLSGQ
ncbi:hypothetical protein AAC387_Pa09g2031 [Persea americana]